MSPLRPPPVPLTHYARVVLGALSQTPIASKRDALCELTAVLHDGLACEGLTREQQARLCHVAHVLHDLVLEPDPEPAEAAQAA